MTTQGQEGQVVGILGKEDDGWFVCVLSNRMIFNEILMYQSQTPLKTKRRMYTRTHSLDIT